MKGNEMENISVLIRSEEEKVEVKDRMRSVCKGYDTTYKYSGAHTPFYITIHPVVKECFWIHQLPSMDMRTILTASEFLERYPAKTAKELFDEDAELVEAVKHIANNCDRTCKTCGIAKADINTNTECCRCPSYPDNIWTHGYQIYLDNRQTYIDYAKELKAKKEDPTEGGKHTPLNPKEMTDEQIKAWQESAEKNPEIVQYYNDVKDHSWEYTSAPSFIAYHLLWRVPADCITEGGMPKGRALVGLFSRFYRITSDGERDNSLLQYGIVDCIDSDGFYIVNTMMGMKSFKHAEYVSPKLAKQIMGKNNEM